jgi:hypothetical protein
MTAENIIIQIVDQNGPAFRDLFIHIRTKQRLGQVFIDASPLGSNNAAVNWTGVGTSPAVVAAGGATSSGDITGVLTNHVIRYTTATAGGASTITLDASASATDNWYQNMCIMLISGTGAGQFGICTSYVGSTKVATIHRSWNTNPSSGTKAIILPTDDIWNISSSAELSAIPTASSKYADQLKFIFQRFAYKRTQTSTTQTLFKADNSTSLASGTVADDGTTQTSGKLS